MNFSAYGLVKHVRLFRYSGKEIASNAPTTEGHLFLVCQGMYCMLNALKENAKKNCNQNWRMASAVFVWVAAPRTRSSLWSKSWSQLRWCGHVNKLTQERFSKQALLDEANGKIPVGRPRTQWTNYIEDLGWNRVGLHPSEMMGGDGRPWSVAA